MSSTQTVELRPLSAKPDSTIFTQNTRPSQVYISPTSRTSSTEAIIRSQDAANTTSATTEDTTTSPPEDDHSPSSNVTTIPPDGGYGWVVILSCSLMTFWFNGLSGSWGVIQTALLNTSLPSSTPTATITFVGSLNLCLCVSLGIFGVRLISLLGARWTAMLGVTLMGVGEISAGFATGSVGGLFGGISVVVGMGTCLVYVVSNSVPPQWFGRKLGMANSVVKFGGGVGSCVLSIALQALITAVGTKWMFRILGGLTLVTGLPAAWLVKERYPLPRRSILGDLSLFKGLPFTAIFVSSALGTFALFVPPFFLPLFAQSAGLSAQTGAALVAGFNACTAVGRLLAGPLCDFMGPMNMFLLTMTVNAVSMLAIWPVAGGNLGLLVLFAVANGVANGAFFVVLPTTVARVAGPGREAVAMSLNISGWTAGYLLGTPIAGYLLAAAGGDGGNSESVVKGVDAYRPAIFYAGGVAFASAVFVFVARMSLERSLKKKV